MERVGRPSPATVVVALLLVMAIATFGFARSDAVLADGQEPRAVIEYTEDWTPVLRVTEVYDLSNGSEQRQFRAIRPNDTARQSTARRVANRWKNRTTDSNPGGVGNHTRIDVASNGSVGSFTVVMQTELALVGHNTVAFDEPFVDGFRPDHPVLIRVPDAFHIDYVSPEPAESNDTAVMWTAGTDLSDVQFGADLRGDYPNYRVLALVLIGFLSLCGAGYLSYRAYRN